MKNIHRRFAALFAAAFAVMLGMGIIVPLMPIYAEHMGATGIWIGIIFSGFSLSRLIFMPIMGRISDKKGRKKFIALGLFFYTLLSLGYVFAENVYSLVWVRVLHGLASAMVIPIIMAYIGDIAPKGKEGRFMGYFNTSFFLGMGLGPFIGGFLNDAFSMNSAFYAMTILATLSLLIIIFALPEESARLLEKAEHKKEISFKKLLNNDLIKGLVLYRFITAAGRGPLMAFLPIFAAQFKITASQIGFIITSNMLLMSLLQAPFGRIADKYSKIRMIILSGIISGLALFIMPFMKTFSGLFFANIFMGLAGAIGMPAATAINAIAGRKHGMASAMGLFSSAMSAGMVIAPLIAGILMDTAGIKYVFYFGAFTSFAGIYFFRFYAKKYKRVIEEEKYPVTA